MTPCSPLPASTVRTEREESLTRGSFLLLPTLHCTPTLSCPPEMTSRSPCSACLSFPPPHAPNTQVDSKSRVWQSWDSYKRNAGNGLRRAGGGGGATGPCAQDPASHPHRFLSAPDPVRGLRSRVTATKRQSFSPIAAGNSEMHGHCATGLPIAEGHSLARRGQTRSRRVGG